MEKPKYKSPFKDKRLFISEIDKFLKKYRATVYNHARRISDYFEMSIYNSVIKYYENSGYKVYCENLINGEFRYKLTPTGYPQNFSYFVVEKTYHYRKSSKNYKFEIHHNVAVESGIDKDIFVTPDIIVIARNGLRQLRDRRYFFSGNRAYYYADNSKLQTFFEVKNLYPFPELLFSFVGILNELKNDIFSKKKLTKRPFHLAPALLMSGGGNHHTFKIKKCLTQRFDINIFYSLFFSPSQPYSKYYRPSTKKIGSI